MTIPEAAVEAAARLTYQRQHAECRFPMGDWENLEGQFREPWMGDARAALEAALPFIQAQTLLDAVDAFPLETIHAPDNAVVWMMRRAEEIREGAG